MPHLTSLSMSINMNRYTPSECQPHSSTRQPGCSPRPFSSCLPPSSHPQASPDHPRSSQTPLLSHRWDLRSILTLPPPASFAPPTLRAIPHSSSHRPQIFRRPRTSPQRAVERFPHLHQTPKLSHRCDLLSILGSSQVPNNAAPIARVPPPPQRLPLWRHIRPLRQICSVPSCWRTPRPSRPCR